MDIKSVKKQADCLYMKYRKQMIPEFFFIGYASLLAQYLQSGLFSFFVSLFLCPIAHGYVKCSMKIVDEEKPVIDCDESMVGIIDFVRVSPVYLVRKICILFIPFLCGLPSLFYSIDQFSFEWVSYLGNAILQTELFIPYFELISLVFHNSYVFINIFICIIIYLCLSVLLTPVPYIMEQNDFSWSESLIVAVKLMKKQFIVFIQLYLLYFFRHMIYFMIAGMIVFLIGKLNEILMLFCMVASLILYIDLFKGRFEIAKYLFYKELKGDLYEESDID